MADWTDWGARRDEARAALALFVWPLRGGAEIPPSGEPAASWAFPLAGLVVGVVGALVYAVVAGAGAPALAAGLAVAATALVNRGMQERELAQAADDWAEGTGAFAVVLGTALRVTAVYAAGSALGIAGATAALVGANVLARGLLPAALYLGAAEQDQTGRPAIVTAIAALVLTALLAWLALGVKAGIAAALAAAAAMALAAMAARRGGGALGALEQAAETAALLAAAALS